MIRDTDVIAEGFKGEKAIVLPYSVCNYQALNNITSKLHITHIGYYPTAKSITAIDRKAVQNIF